MSNSPQTPRVNPILIGRAEEIDLLLPAVRQMMERQGIYLASDTERPGWTVPLVVNAEGLWSMQLDSRLNPERFKDTVQIAGPFYAPGEEVESAAHSTHTAALGIDLAALRARVVSAIERITSGTGQMRVPADLTDPDLVLADVLTLLDALDPHCTDSAKGGSEAQPMFYIQDTRSFVGNCPMWWGPDGRGYVTRLDEAGRYTEEEAIRQNQARDTDIPWPCDEIDKLARPTVDFQHMRPRSERLAELAAQASDAEVEHG